MFKCLVILFLNKYSWINNFGIKQFASICVCRKIYMKIFLDVCIKFHRKIGKLYFNVIYRKSFKKVYLEF